MLRPDVFGDLGLSLAGDALFECCYQHDFPVVVQALREDFDGSYKVSCRRLAAAERSGWPRFRKPFELFGYAYSPDPSGKVLLPFGSRPGGWSRTCGHGGWRVALRRQARRDLVSLPERDPRAGDGAELTGLGGLG